MRYSASLAEEVVGVWAATVPLGMPSGKVGHHPGWKPLQGFAATSCPQLCPLFLPKLKFAQKGGSTYKEWWCDRCSWVNKAARLFGEVLVTAECWSTQRWWCCGSHRCSSTAGSSCQTLTSPRLVQRGVRWHWSLLHLSNTNTMRPVTPFHPIKKTPDLRMLAGF